VGSVGLGRGVVMVTGLDPTPGAVHVPPLLVPVSMYFPSGMFGTVISILPESDITLILCSPCKVTPLGLQNM